MFVTIPWEPWLEINEFGTVRNIESKVPKKLVLQSKGKYISLIIDGRYLLKGETAGRKRRYLIHRLVASLFLEAEEGRDYVNHIDGNRFNNHFSNLEWCTTEENNNHAFSIGLQQKRKRL